MEGNNMEGLNIENQRNSINSNSGEVCDRISELPVEILHHILCLLPLTTVVQTSLLSKRWQLLWTTIPCLEFDQRPFYFNDTKFINFVNSFMARHHGPNIQKFRVSSSLKSHVYDWVQAAMMLDPQEVELHVCSPGLIQFPHSLFMSPFLKVLELRVDDGFLELPTVISLPQLKKLHLGYVKVEDTCWSPQLYPNCPSLESLSLEVRKWNVVKVLNISSPSIKTLVINYPPLIYYTQSSIQCEVVLSTPRLESFMFGGLMALDYRFGSIPLLRTARLDFEDRHLIENLGLTPLSDPQDLAPCLGGILKAIRNVEFMYLSSWTTEILSSNKNLLDNFDVFHNLKDLNMETSYEEPELRGIIRMLQLMPNLQFLTVHFNSLIIKVDPTKSGELEGELSRDFVPPCLKVVKIKKLGIQWSQIMLVKRILGTSESLELMIIEPRARYEGGDAVLRAHIGKLPIASSSCEIRF